MRKFLIATAAAALMLASQSAGAAEITATISTVDINARIIVIDGRSIHVPTTINIEVLKVGEKVTIVYTEKDGQLTAVSIVVS